MRKQLKTAKVMMLLMGLSSGAIASFANEPSFSVNEYQQHSEKGCKGIVRSSNGEEIIGASVIVKGNSQHGTITDIDGNFTLLNVPTGSTLIISYLGYQTVEVVWKGKPLKIHLKEDSTVLEDVVITGYGTSLSRSKLTTSITKVNNKEIVLGTKANPSSALAGNVPGLVVQQNSGRPGAVANVILRGGTSLNGGGSPLYVIDGVVRDINDFNPEDIEDMQVLKDASATAIYGARANNGVILINTKHGKTGKASISFKTKTGLSKMGYMPTFLNAEEYIYWQRMGIKNAAAAGSDFCKSWMNLLNQANGFGTGNLLKDPKTGEFIDGLKDPRGVYSVMKLNDENRYKLNEGWKSMIDPVYGDEILFTETNLADKAFRSTAITQDYNISVSGGNEKGHYYAGLGYYNEKGFPINSWYKRFNFTANADYKITNWLTSYSSFSYIDTKWRDEAQTTGRGYDYFGRMLSIPPTMRPYNENGEKLMGPHTMDGDPSFQPEKFFRRNNRNKYSFSQTFKFDITKNIYLKLVGNLYIEDTWNESMDKDYLERPGFINTSRKTSARYSKKLTETYNVLAGWKQSFNKHNFDTMLGFEYYNLTYKGLSASGQEAPTDDFIDLGYTSSDKNKRGIDTEHDAQRMFSYFGKINYDFANKYLISLTFRADGSSKLIDNRWGFFPGISAAWNILNEPWMKGARDVLSFLKIRSGYGQNGNINPSYIGSYTLQGSYGTNGKYDSQLGFNLHNLPLPSITWEKSSTFDAAIDASFLNNKINMTLGYFNRRTKDLYANINLPGSAGYSKILTNNGEVQNQGLEFETSYKILQKKDWKWQVGGNLTFIKSTIEKLPSNGNERNRQGGVEIYTGKKLSDGTYEKVWVGGYQEGQQPGKMYGFIAEGIYKDEADIRDHGVLKDITMGRTIYSPDEYAKLTPEQQKRSHCIAPGDVKWKDINGDGIIDRHDQAYLGTSVPKWTGGFNSTLSWKGLSLYAKFDFALGHTTFDWIRQRYMTNNQAWFNMITDIKDSWTPENQNAKWPRYDRADGQVKNNYGRYSSLLTHNGNYLCVRDITLTYSLPKLLMNKLGIQDFTVALTGQNLAYLKSSTFTPEGRGSQKSIYPMPRTFVITTQLTF